MSVRTHDRERILYTLYEENEITLLYCIIYWSIIAILLKIIKKEEEESTINRIKLFWTEIFLHLFIHLERKKEGYGKVRIIDNETGWWWRWGDMSVVCSSVIICHCLIFQVFKNSVKNYWNKEKEIRIITRRIYTHSILLHSHGLPNYCQSTSTTHGAWLTVIFQRGWIFWCFCAQKCDCRFAAVICEMSRYNKYRLDWCTHMK